MSLSEPAVLEPIVYQEILSDDGRRVGWAPKPEDRHRFDHGSGRPNTGHAPLAPLEPEQQARDYLSIVAELDAWAIGDERLYEQLQALYETKPLIADRIARAAVEGAQSSRLHDPTAFLASRLRPRK